MLAYSQSIGNLHRDFPGTIRPAILAQADAANRLWETISHLQEDFSISIVMSTIAPEGAEEHGEPSVAGNQDTDHEADTCSISSPCAASTPATNPSTGTSIVVDLFDDIFSTSHPASPLLEPGDVVQQAHSTPQTSSMSTDLQSREPSDIPRLRTTHTTAGYRDGIASAREAATQPGFDEGYIIGSALGLCAGYLIGIVEGLSEALKEQSGGLEAVSKQLREDLSISRLMSPEYIDQDGTWKWSVESKAEDVTPREVANAHPLILKWRNVVKEYMARADIARNRLFGESRDIEPK